MAPSQVHMPQVKNNWPKEMVESPEVEKARRSEAGFRDMSCLRMAVEGGLLGGCSPAVKFLLACLQYSGFSPSCFWKKFSQVFGKGLTLSRLE